MGWVAVTSADRPERRDTGPGSGRDEGGRVLPFPPGGRDGLRRAEAGWTFTTNVRWIGGTEGEWLRRELASVLRDLLAWARDDMAGDVVQDDGEERAA